MTKSIDKYHGLPSTKTLYENDMSFTHSALSVCVLPYRKVEGISYEKRIGKYHLSIDAGKLANPHTGILERQQIPYGTIPRLLMISFISQAIQNKSPMIEVDTSFTKFMRDVLGYKITGGKNGSIARFKFQISNLISSHMTIGFQVSKDIADTISFNPIKRTRLFFPKNSAQKSFWNSEIVLSRDFYDSLQRHGLPINNRVLKKLRHHARAMDIYLWLSYRNNILKDKLFLSWHSLKEQFGSESTSIVNFKKQFMNAMAKVVDAHPFRVALARGGVELSPSSLAINKKIYLPNE